MCLARHRETQDLRVRRRIIVVDGARRSRYLGRVAVGASVFVCGVAVPGFVDRGVGGWIVGGLGAALGAALLISGIGGLVSRCARTSPEMPSAGHGPTPPPPREHPAAPVPRPRAQGPVTVRNSKNDTEFRLHRSGLVVLIAWARVGGGSRWKPHLDLPWEDIADLAFDHGSHDSVVSLYAVPVGGGPRQHIVDARSFTQGQWHDVALAVEGLSGGRLVLDLGRRDRLGSPRDT
ncbi:hypothetical protein [Streptomyces sp. NPDC088746]|uniref:hypothetical protein n=1 Tax=Streptomyces sp. NPDC088746 TaxID=3365885 RepID=UPI00381864F6